MSYCSCESSGFFRDAIKREESVWESNVSVDDYLSTAFTVYILSVCVCSWWLTRYSSVSSVLLSKKINWSPEQQIQFSKDQMKDRHRERKTERQSAAASCSFLFGYLSALRSHDTMTVHQRLDMCGHCLCVCIDGVHVGFYTSLSCSHQSWGDTGEIKSLYEGLSLLPGPVTPLINIKYFSSSSMTRDPEDTTSSYTAPLETYCIPPCVDTLNQSKETNREALMRHIWSFKH